jgi:hypothetical protein
MIRRITNQLLSESTKGSLNLWMNDFHFLMIKQKCKNLEKERNLFSDFCYRLKDTKMEN